MLERLRHSLAVRLGALFAALFALGSAVVFALLYWTLAHVLGTRERAAVEQKAQDYAEVYEAGGPSSLRALLNAEQKTPGVRSVFVRILGNGGETTFAQVPPDWVQGQAEQVLVPDGWGGWQPEIVRSVRVPRDAQNDFTVASQRLSDGELLQVARSTDNRTVLLEPLRRTFLAAGGGVLLLAAVGGAILAWRITRPVREINATARRIIATGDLAARVPAPGGGGELGELVRQLNAVLGQNAALIGAMRETLDNLAHDLRTPLARLRGTADLALQAQGDPAAVREALADCVEESERVLRLLEAILDVSAAETGTLPLRRARIDLQPVLARAADLYREIAEEKGIALSCAGGPPVWVEADAARLGQAAANLVDNALKYTPPGGSVRLSARGEGGRGTLEVSDSGPGIPEPEREKIWRRLYRADASRSQRGLGLGLSLVKAIAEAHGGAAAVGDAPGGGACFSIRLPLAVVSGSPSAPVPA
ncbi:MAG TPA: HAMP domain-containing sensor histidine kinase [Opitutaceae bacterium]|jgi:signal transduction histidine kinase|nr:HAMP domain-containing sensor histidine kinase [Opitutaceae bacterium]